MFPATISFGPWTEAPSMELIAAKDRISTLEAAKRWELVKKMVNPYEIVYTHEDPFFHPSIALTRPLSRSYFKMIEMLHVLQFFELIPKQLAKVRTAHVAEGPGGFIQAVVELCERNKRILSSAVAMTLKPTDQRVPGWRRASSFLHHHQEVKLHFGTDGTGDVYLTANQDSFVAAVSPGVNLFTADGGFDFSVNYEIQEKRVFHLLVSSTVTGLRSLATDGFFVLKIFETFSEHTKFLIVLAAQCFKEWMLYKPSLSRPCNSEQYFLGRGFRGIPPIVLQHLQALQAEAANDRYPTDLSGCFTAEETAYFDANTALNTEAQLTAISRAEVYANQPELWYNNQLPLDFEKSRLWCERYRVPYAQKQPLAVTRVNWSAAPQ